MKLTTFVLLASVAAFVGCSGTSSNPSNKTVEIKKGVQPIADAEIAVIELENSAAYGTIKLELYSNIAPKMVERFKELAREGFYDGVEFHRINQSVIQGGDPLSKKSASGSDDKEKGSDSKSDPGQIVGSGKSNKPNVPAEFSDLLYDTGILGAARGPSNDSANSQFFITLKREPGFDQRYTIFGKVIEGLNNVRTISGVQPKDGERPVEPVRIKTIRIESKQ